MPTSMISRETILNAIRCNLPQDRVEHPGIPDFPWTDGPLKAAFVKRLEEAGGVAHADRSAAARQPNQDFASLCTRRTAPLRKLAGV